MTLGITALDEIPYQIRPTISAPQGTTVRWVHKHPLPVLREHSLMPVEILQKVIVRIVLQVSEENHMRQDMRKQY